MTVPVIDYVYCNLLEKILREGTTQKDRTSVGSSTQLFGQTLSFDTQDKYAPFLQCRTFGPKTSFLEWKWMMSGNTDSSWLEERGVNIWKGNTTREFLDSRGLLHLPEKDIGKSYGYQFRNFGGVDQIEKVFKSLKDNPTSRRHVISIWNVGELDEGALEPCSHLYEFMFDSGTLHLYQHMRSADVLYGAGYNLSFGTYMLFAFARALGYKAGKIMLSMTNAHIYENQLDIVDEMLVNFKINIKGKRVPKLTVSELDGLDGLMSLEYDDVRLWNWERGPVIGNAQMAV